MQASHRKRHLAAVAKPDVRERLDYLKAEWKGLNHVHRGDRLVQLVANGCSDRGLANNLGLDEGTIRRAIKIAQLPEAVRKAIKGASPVFEKACRTFVGRLYARLSRELGDGTPSDELRDDLVWFALTKYPQLCCVWHVERLMAEIVLQLWLRSHMASTARHASLPGPVTHAYPLPLAIRLARPHEDTNSIEIGNAVEWLVNLILILEPVKKIRDAAIEKLQVTLFHLQLNSYLEIQTQAKNLTPSALGVLLRKRPPEKPLYLLDSALLPLLEHAASPRPVHSAASERWRTNPYEWQARAGASLGASLPAVRRLLAGGLLNEAENGPRGRREFTITRLGRSELQRIDRYLEDGLQRTGGDLETLLRLVCIAVAEGNPELAKKLLLQGAEQHAKRSKNARNLARPLRSLLLWRNSMLWHKVT